VQITDCRVCTETAKDEKRKRKVNCVSELEQQLRNYFYFIFLYLNVIILTWGILS
jgi:hypothetical protein